MSHSWNWNWISMNKKLLLRSIILYGKTLQEFCKSQNRHAFCFLCYFLSFLVETDDRNIHATFQFLVAKTENMLWKRDFSQFSIWRLWERTKVLEKHFVVLKTVAIETKKCLSTQVIQVSVSYPHEKCQIEWEYLGSIAISK